MNDEYLLKAQRRLIAIREKENALVNRAVLILLGCALLMAAAFCALQCLFAWINLSMYPGG